MRGKCVICSIVDGREPSRRVLESRSALAFLDINPAADGHTLVVPKEHFADIWMLRADAADDVWRLAVSVARLLKDALRPDGMTLFQANGRAGWQDISHFHLHLVPRWLGDPLVRPWHSRPGEPARLDEIAARLSHSETDERA